MNTKYLWVIAYIATIFGANWAISTFGFVPVGFGLLAPAGVYFAGIAFSLRDGVQENLGKRWTVFAIVAGALLSALVSPRFALASGGAFLLSETADFLVYTPLRERSRLLAMMFSNVIGDTVDSALFLLLAFGSLHFLVGQLVGKWEMIIPSIALMLLYHRYRQEPAFG